MRRARIDLRLAFGVACAATLACADPACAGAFNPAAGEGVGILTTRFTDGRDFVDGGGRRWRAPKWRKFETQLHVEYALNDWLAAIARPRLVSIHEDGRKGFRGEGLGASEIGLQARLLRWGDWVVAAQAFVRTPAAPDGRLAAWEDRGGGEGRLLIGRSFSAFGLPGFFDNQVGVRTRRGRADEIVGEQTLGLRPIPPLLAMLQLFTTQSLESPKRRAARGAPAGEHQSKAQLALVYDLAPKWSVSAAAFRTLVLRDGAKESGATLSVWRRF